MMKTVNTESSFVEIWFTDQASKALEIELKQCQFDANFWVVIINMRYSTEPRFLKCVKGHGFCHWQENVVINMVKN